jgi:hypothetical protein
VSDSLEGKPDETPTVEVRVYRDGRLVHRELCESDDDAALVVEEWNEIEGTEFEVDDLSSRHRPDQILDLEPVGWLTGCRWSSAATPSPCSAR